MIQGTTPTLLFKFSVDLALIKEWRICFYQEGKENLIKTNTDCVVDENKVIYVKLTQEETLNFDVDKYIKIQVKALTQDNNVISSQTITTHTHEILDKMLFMVENTTPTIIDTSAIEFEFDTEPCGFGLDFENLYIEQTGTGGGGTNGKDGVGIQSVVQTTTSTEDNGKNVITVTLTNGNKSTFVVENGSQGSQGLQGQKGDKGADGYTPVKGKDYFTIEDVQNIVNQVIAQMPIEDAVLANSNNPVKSKAIYEYVELGLQSNLDSANQYSDNVGNIATSYTDTSIQQAIIDSWEVAV
jgi:hypothetical protein